MEVEQQELAVLSCACAGLTAALLLSKRRKRRIYMREVNTRRETLGQYHTRVQEMRLGDPDYFYRYCRMSPDTYRHLLSLVGPRILHQATHRLPISPGERLMLTLRCA